MNAHHAGLELELAGVQVPEPTQAQLSILLDWCVEETEMSGDPHLQGVIIAPDAGLADHANRILKDYAGRLDVPSQVMSSASAFALPVEVDHRLLTFIFLAESLVLRLEHGPSSYDGLGLTLLEEFLHAKHYTQVFDRRGFIHYPISAGDACQTELLDFSFHLLDEYTIGRWKAEMVNAELSYGESLAQAIEKGMHRLVRTINDASKGLVEAQEAWSEVHRTLNSDVLGPLVRDAGRRALLPHKPSPAGDPSESEMFRSWVQAAWSEFEELLDASFNRPSEADDNLIRFAQVLSAFLSRIGIIFTQMLDGGCWIDFNDSWSRQFQNSAA